MRTPIACLVLTTAVAAPAQEWKPAPGPLATRWAADVKPDAPHPDYPRPTLVRPEWQSLNGLWQFAPAKATDPPPYAVDLPERILVPFPVESSLSGIGRHEERMWYRRTFTVPESWRGKRIMLNFEAVDWEATVYVNRTWVGAHRGGYDPFSMDITEAIAHAGETELLVQVYDPTDAGTQPRGKQVLKPEGIWYTPTSGIWQSVWLEPVPANAIRSLVVTPDAGTGDVRIRLPWSRNARFTDVTAVVSKDGVEIARAVRSHEAVGDLVLRVPSPHLWSPEDPFLYDLRVSFSPAQGAPGHLKIGDDAVTTYFAFRTIEVGPDDKGVTRIKLNGRPYFGVGPLDQGFWPDGISTAPTDEALRADVEAMKDLGFNMVRKHVKVEPERWYTWCDRLGLLVWQDMPSGDAYIGGNDPDLVRSPQSAGQFENELGAIIDARRRHPSIVMWVAFNEGWGQYDTPRIVEFIRQRDPTRLVSNASGWTDRGVGDVIDMHAYPGPGAPAPEPTRAAVLGEFGGLGLAVKGHTWVDRSWGYRGVADAEDLAFGYENLLRECWRLNREKGLSAVVYTQLTDVETECNGLLTYDRVLKTDPARIAAANRGRFAPMVQLVPAADTQAAEWRYTLEAPPDGWTAPGFDDSPWKAGPAGFGTEGTPGAIVRTRWDSSDIWIRRTVQFRPPPGLFEPVLWIHHDEDAEIYLNGVLAATVKGYTTAYTPVRISPEARAAIAPGPVTIAIHCRQTGGGQYIDAGLAAFVKEQP